MALTANQKLVHAARIAQSPIPAIRPVRLLEGPRYSEAQAPRFRASLGSRVLCLVIVDSSAGVFLMAPGFLVVISACHDVLAL